MVPERADCVGRVTYPRPDILWRFNLQQSQQQDSPAERDFARTTEAAVWNNNNLININFPININETPVLVCAEENGTEHLHCHFLCSVIHCWCSWWLVALHPVGTATPKEIPLRCTRSSIRNPLTKTRTALPRTLVEVIKGSIKYLLHRASFLQVLRWVIEF